MTFFDLLISDRTNRCLHLGTLIIVELFCRTSVFFPFSNENFKVKTDTSKAILSPDGQYACAGSHDGSLIFWNMEQKTCERVLQRRHS